MKFIHTYKGYRSINEADNQAPGATPSNTGTASQAVKVPDWFEEGFYSAKKNTKAAKAFGLEEADKAVFWGMIDELGNKIRKQPFTNVKDLQAFLWTQMEKLECPNIDRVDKDGKPLPPRKLLQVLNDHRKERGKEAVNQKRFVDGLYGSQTNLIVGAVTKLLQNEMALTEIEKKRANAVADALNISSDPNAKPGAGMEYLLTTIGAADTNDTIKGAVEKKSRRIKIKDRDKDGKSITQEQLDFIHKYLTDPKNGYRFLKAVDKNYGDKYVWIRNEYTQEEIAALKKSNPQAKILAELDQKPLVASLRKQAEDEKLAKTSTDPKQKKWWQFWKGGNQPTEAVGSAGAASNEVAKALTSGGVTVEPVISDGVINWGGPQPTIGGKVVDKPDWNYSVTFADFDGKNQVRFQPNDTSATKDATKDQIKKALSAVPQLATQDKGTALFVDVSGKKQDEIIQLVNTIGSKIPMFGKTA